MNAPETSVLVIRRSRVTAAYVLGLVLMAVAWGIAPGSPSPLFLCAGLLVLSGLAGGWQRFFAPVPRSFLGFVWSLFIGLCVTTGVGFLALLAWAPEILVAQIFAAGIPLGALHYGVRWITIPPRREGGGDPQAVAPALGEAAGGTSSARMVRGTSVLLLGMALITGWQEWRHPPVSVVYESTSFTGSTTLATHFARRGMESGFWTSKLMQINWLILAIECGLVAGAVGAGLTARKGPAEEDPARTASRMTGRAAMVLHASVWLLPLAEAGADVVSFLTVPLVAVLLVPNVLSWIFLSGQRHLDPSLESGQLRRQLAHHLLFAILWTVAFLISMVGLDFKNPMGGAVLGTVALWLSSLSAWFLIRHYEGNREAADVGGKSVG